MKLSTNYWKSLSTLAAGLVFSSLITAPASATNLMEVYEAAKSNDAVVGAARASYDANRQAVPQARSALMPSLGASASTSWTERSFPGSLVTDPMSPLAGQEVPDQEFNDHGTHS